MIKKMKTEAYYYDVTISCFMKRGENFSPYMNPYIFLQGSTSAKNNDKYIFSLLQNELHGLLNAYLNGYDFKGRSTYLYPLLKISVKSAFDQARERIRYLVSSAGKNIDVALSDSAIINGQNNVSEIIAAAHRILEKVIYRLAEMSAGSISVRAGLHYQEKTYLCDRSSNIQEGIISSDQSIL